jgi:electron transport complex protein RnfB
MPLSAIVSLGTLGLVLGVVLGIAAKKFAVAVDPREEKIMGILPGANCGACGFPSCHAYCSALLSGEAPVEACPVGGKDISLKLAEVIAVICCRGGKDRVGEKFIYRGVEDCLAAHLLQGGFKDCAYGCLGLGSCVDVCPFGALSMGGNGLPVVDEGKCTGCGMCVKKCPRGIIRLIPRSQEVYVGCVSKDKGRDVRSICKVGCFGCGLCAKAAVDGAITMDGNLPKIQPADMEKMAKAIEKCPAKVFVLRG